MINVGNEYKGINAALFQANGENAVEDRIIISISRPGLGMMAHYAGHDAIKLLRDDMADVIAAINSTFPEIDNAPAQTPQS